MKISLGDSNVQPKLRNNALKTTPPPSLLTVNASTDENKAFTSNHSQAGRKNNPENARSKCLAELGAPVQAKCYSVAIPSSREGGKTRQWNVGKDGHQAYLFCFQNVVFRKS